MRLVQVAVDISLEVGFTVTGIADSKDGADE